MQFGGSIYGPVQWTVRSVTILSKVALLPRSYNSELGKSDEGKLCCLLLKPKHLARIPVQEEQLSFQTRRRQRCERARFFTVPRLTHDAKFERLERRESSP